jgi:hypothetical protein
MSGSFSPGKTEIRAYGQKIHENGDYVPQNHGARGYQQSVVDPDDLKGAHDCRYSRIYAGTRAAPEHYDQVRDSRERSAEPGNKSKDL